MKLRTLLILLGIFINQSIYGAAYPPPPCPDSSGFITMNDGAQIHYELSGPANGQTIVFTPPFTGGAIVFACYRNYFCAQGYKVLLIDTRGQGLSRAPLSASYSIDRMTADIKAVVTALGIALPFYLVGWSLGGAVAQRYVTLYPHDVSKLVILDSNAKFANDATSITGFPAAFFYAALASAALGAITNSMLPIEGTFDAVEGVPLCLATSPVGSALAVLAGITKGVLISDPQAMGLIISQAIIPWDGRAALSSITIPTLIIYGCLDTLTPPAGSIYMAKHIPHATIVGLPGQPHAATSLDTDVINNLMSNFFQGIPIASNITCNPLILPDCSSCAVPAL